MLAALEAAENSNLGRPVIAAKAAGQGTAISKPSTVSSFFAPKHYTKPQGSSKAKVVLRKPIVLSLPYTPTRKYRTSPS